MLTGLEELYLYDNQLTGHLPLELMNLTSLQRLHFRQVANTPNELCAPLNADFQAWLDAISEVSGPDCDYEVAAEEAEALPTVFVLHGSYPNPFHTTTRILFDLPSPARVGVQVFDVIGRKVLVTAPVAMTAGWNREVTLASAHLSSGLYLYRLVVESEHDTQRHSGTLTLVR